MPANVIQGFFTVHGPHGKPTATRQTIPPAQPERAGAHGSAGSHPYVVRAKQADPVTVDRSVLMDAGGGTPLPARLRRAMERALGADFSNVRVHVGQQAGRIGADAFTAGDDIYFAPGKFEPNSPEGRRLLGHELAHVIQQRQGRVHGPAGMVTVVRDPALEAEADQAGARSSLPIMAFPQPPAVPHPQLYAGAPRGPRSTQSSASLVVQPANLKVSIKSGRYVLTGRPAFRSFVKPAVVEKYNTKHGTNLDPDTISLSDEELDQCHKVSWKDIRDSIQNLLNGDIGTDDFRDNVARLYDNETTLESLNAFDQLNRVVKSLKKGTSVIQDAYELGALLNSATPNLRLDDSRINRKIRQHFDPSLAWSPGGSHLSMTPHTRDLAESDFALSSVRWSPGGTHGFSSTVGEFDRGDLTPRTSNANPFT